MVPPIDLGTLGESNSGAAAINDAGQIVGISTDYGSPAGFRGALWAPDGSVTDIGTLGGSSTSPYAINNAGQIVGWSEVPGGEEHAFIWDAENGMSDLGTLGGDSSQAIGLNELGHVVGYSDVADSAAFHAFVWAPETGMVDLGTFGGFGSAASDINDSGQIVGVAGIPGVGTRAVMWDPVEGEIDLGSLPGNYSTATGINNAGRVVGFSRADGNFAYHGFVWDRVNGMVDLGTVGGTTSMAWRINESGQIAGWSQTEGDARSVAVVWSPTGEAMQLGGLGGSYAHAVDIDETGQVVGVSATADSNDHATLWQIPAPAPPRISIGDVTVDEGAAGGPTVMRFPVTLSHPSSTEVSVRFRVVENTATAPEDFDDRDGKWRTLRFKPSKHTGFTATTKNVSVKIAGDVLAEDDESLRVVLTEPSAGWSIGRAAGLGTIRDVDPNPTGSVGISDVAIGHATIVEGDIGTNRVKLWLTLPEAPVQQGFLFRTEVVSDDATAGTDFKEFTKTVAFEAGRTRRMITVVVHADDSPEPSEVIQVKYTNSSLTPVGYVTILDDD